LFFPAEKFTNFKCLENKNKKKKKKKLRYQKIKVPKNGEFFFFFFLSPMHFSIINKHFGPYFSDFLSDSYS